MRFRPRGITARGTYGTLFRCGNRPSGSGPVEDACFSWATKGCAVSGDRYGSEKLRPAFNFLAGMCSEIFSSMVYVPEEVIKSRMMLGKITDRGRRRAA